MRPPNSSLPARDACRALLQPQQQRRVLSSAAVYPGYAWSSSSSASSSSSSPFPLSFTLPAVASSSKSKASRLPRHFFAFAYSTSNPAYPLPGSNNEIDPHGVDYSLFETEDDTYNQHASTSAISQDASNIHLEHASGSAASNSSSAALSAPTQLLVRLLKEDDFETATTVLYELQRVRTPLDEPMPIFSTAALWAIRQGKKDQMLNWMALCPSYTPGTKYLETASSAPLHKQAKSIANSFRQCFMFMLESYGDDLRLLSRASMLAAEKGYWRILQSTLAQILRYGVGRKQAANATSSELAWQYFNRLVQINQAQRAPFLKDEMKGEKQDAFVQSTMELRKLYNLGIRTLALAGRLNDAAFWARKSTEVHNGFTSRSRILEVEPFTENLLMEELVKAGSSHVKQARVLAKRLGSARARNPKRKMVDIDSVIERMEAEATFSSTEEIEAASDSTLNVKIQACLEEGDVVAAREYLLTTLRAVQRIQQGEGDVKAANDFLRSRLPAHHRTQQGDDDYHPAHERGPVFSYLPSARTLSELQEVTQKLGTIAMTSSLTETEMLSIRKNRPKNSSLPLTAAEFLQAVQSLLHNVRGGQGLWETATLYGHVKQGKFQEAVQFYVGKAGFRLPAGGITTELVQMALGHQVSASPKTSGRSEEGLDTAQAFRGKQWPSTHAINLMLRAIAGVCVNAKDHNRLEQVYNRWREASLPSPAEEEETEATDGYLAFGSWPPARRPDSYTFDPFLRAFGRLNVDVHPASNPASSDNQQPKVEKQLWGSSQAVLDIIRDMTDVFGVQPSISSWTIALECLAREGSSRWSSTTEILARAVGINTVSPLSLSTSALSPNVVEGAHKNFASATSATYTALMRALIRVPHQHGGSMVDQAAAIRDDLLVRTQDLDIAVQPHLLTEKENGVESDEDDEAFWSHLLNRWQAVQQAVSERAEGADKRQRWDADKVLTGNQGKTLEAMRELWLLETTRADTQASAS